MKKEPKHPHVKKVLQCDGDIFGGNRRFDVTLHWCYAELVRGRRRIEIIKKRVI